MSRKKIKKRVKTPLKDMQELRTTIRGLMRKLVIAEKDLDEGISEAIKQLEDFEDIT
jgi:hypothetical protein